MTLHICRQNHRTNLLPGVRAGPVADCPRPSCPRLDAKQADNKLGLHHRRCHRDNDNGAMLQPCDVAPVAPPLVVNVKQADNELQACAATVTTTMQPFVVASVTSPLYGDAKQADAAIVSRWSDRSPKSLTRSFFTTPSKPSNSVRRSPSSVGACLLTPSRQSGQNMWPLGRRLALALHDSGLMPIRRLLALLSPPHLRPPILLATVRTLLPPASTPPVVIFV